MAKKPPTDKFADFAGVLPKLNFGCVFDVGANVGNTVAEMLGHHPTAVVHAFEPVQLSYEKLSSRFAGTMQVRCYNFALGATDGEVLITGCGTSKENRIVQEPQVGVPIETIRVQRGDEFSRLAGIGRISFLKVDTEGYDLEVVRGFSNMMSSQQIDAFQVEVSMGLQNRKHVALAAIQDHVAPLGYWLFKIYDQTQEFDGRPIARRADAVFISSTCMEANKRPRKGRKGRRPTLLKRVFARFSR